MQNLPLRLRLIAYFLPGRSQQQARLLLSKFALEINGAETRYARCWARLTQDRIVFLPPLGLAKIENPYSNAKRHLEALNEMLKQLTNPVEQLTTSARDEHFVTLNWKDLITLIKSCHLEWTSQVAESALDLAKDFAAEYVPHHFDAQSANVIMEQINHTRLPESLSTNDDETLLNTRGRCWLLS